MKFQIILERSIRKFYWFEMNKLEIFESQMFLKSNISVLNFCPIG